MCLVWANKYPNPNILVSEKLKNACPPHSVEKMLYSFSIWLEIEEVHSFQENVRGIVSVAMHVPCQGAIL